MTTVLAVTLCLVLPAVAIPQGTDLPEAAPEAAPEAVPETAPAASPSGSGQQAVVLVIRFDDTVQGVSRRFLERGLDEAASRGAALVLLELDTPGGLVDDTRQIVSAITTSKVPVAAYVAPGGARAASAGFIILLCSDVAAMAPGTNTGAAHPVFMPLLGGGEAEPSEEMKAKATNDLAAMVRSLAEERGRSMDLAERAVTESLSFTATEAIQSGLIDVVASSRSELLEALDGREVRRFGGETVRLELHSPVEVRFNPTVKEEVQSFLASPLIALVLMAVAALGIYTEITHPGGIFPGVIGLIALLLFLYSTSTLPVNWAGTALMAVAIVLFLLEVKVTSYGLLTAGGIACFVAGALMMFDGPIPEMRLSIGTVLPVAIVIAAVMIFLLQRVVTAHKARTMTGTEGLPDEIGRALVDLAPVGKVKVHGEYWDARAAGGVTIPAGARVRIVKVGDGMLEVAPAVNEPIGEETTGGA
jgi:membrane-bound serine protease (ClpP class)